MVNPLQNIKLESWPDFFLSIAGVAFVMILGAIIAGHQLPGKSVNWLILFGGMVLFGIGAQITHYKKEHQTLAGVYQSKWRCDFIGNLFAFLGIVFIVYGFLRMAGIYPLNLTVGC